MSKLKTALFKDLKDVCSKCIVDYYIPNIKPKCDDCDTFRKYRSCIRVLNSEVKD